MRTVLVTGGAGLIGSHLVERLLESGASVRVVDNLCTGSLANLQAAAEANSRERGGVAGSRLEVIIGDVRDRELLRKALRNVKYVFHLAAAPEPVSSGGDVYDVQAVNVEGTLNLLHAAVSEGVWRVVLGSCSSVYGTPATCPVSEDAPLGPTSLFGASKVAAESYCHAFHVRHQLDTVVLRYFTVYGPRQRLGPGAGLIANVIDALRRGRPLVDQDVRGFNDLTYVDDVVAATVVAARAPRATGRVINVGSGSMVGIGEIQGILADLLKASVVPGVMRESAGPPPRVIAETRLAAELLDLAPRVPLREGLARMVRWLSDPSAAEEELAGATPW